MLTLTDKQYQILLDLYHELNNEFMRLSEPVQAAFWAKLNSKPVYAKTNHH